MIETNEFSDKNSPSRLWDGRMSVASSEIFSAYVDSISFDIVLAPYDVQVSRAHAKMLEKQAIIDADTLRAILDAFDVIDHEIKSGEFKASIVPTDEDVHTAIERRITELAGDSGKALHTGRSRNDLAQMSGRLYVRDGLDRLSQYLKKMIGTLLDLAENNIGTVMPGKTHLQHAQPILLSHWIVSHAVRLHNDLQRVQEAYDRANVCVLGSGALAGSTLDLDPEFISKELNCSSVSNNSIFAVSTRDYIAETLFACSQIMVNLSCIGEDLVWMSSTECGYATLDDQFSSGSSMMPQKKNPDIAELVRGKAGLTIGSLTAVMSATKSQIFGYNHDLQVDKEALFSALRDTELSLIALEAMISTTVFNDERLSEAVVNEPLLLATDIAETMVSQGTPFRIAYKAVAVCIRKAVENGLSSTALCDFLVSDDLIGAAAKEVFKSSMIDNMRASIERRNTAGGTSTEQVRSTIAQLRKVIN